MDINSLLSPTDTSRAIETQTPTPTPTSNSTPSATPAPFAYVRRSKSGPLNSAATNANSPLSQSMVPSSIPPHLLSPQPQPTPSPPIHKSSGLRSTTPPPSTGPVVDSKSSATSSIEKLADVAAMQNQQSPRPTLPVLRRESYESQLSPSTIFPQIPAVSVTSNPRSSFDVAKVDSTRPIVRTNFLGSSLPLEIQQQTSLIARSIQERPSAFVAHEELIKILHQGFLNHVYPPSSPNAHGDPHSYDLLQDLRAARESMHKLFAMGENLWVDCLRDESMLARSIEEKMGVIEQFVNAVTQEYASTSLWKLYGEWVLHCFNSATDSAANVSEEERIQAEVIFTWDIVLDTWKQAAESTKWRLNDSHLVWDEFIEIVIQDAQRTDTPEAIDIVRKLFEQRLQTPHSNWESTRQNYLSFISNSPFQQEWEQIMVQINKSGAAARAKFADREKFETALQLAQESNNSDAEYQAFVQYLEWERTPEKRKKLDFDITNAIFERAELRFPSDAKLWEEHVLWLIEKRQDELSGGILSVLDRATRHCPWSGVLWSQYLLASERLKQPFAETEKIKHKATNTGLLDVGGIEEVLTVHASWCNFLRRRAFHADPNDENEDLDVAEMGIRGSIENVQELAMKLGSSKTPDPKFRLERIYINFLSESGSWDSAEEAFRGYVPQYGHSWEFWLRFYEWEMTRWRKFIHDEAPGGRSSKNAGPHYATAVLKEALKQPNLDWPQLLMQKLVDHCEDHEDVEELQQAIIEVKHVEKALAGKREKEGTYMQQETAAQMDTNAVSAVAEAVPNGTSTGKRKREQPDNESNKKSRIDDNIEPSVEPPAAEEPPKRDREHAMILVQNLPDGVTETKIRQFFRDCGTVNSIKLMSHSSSAFVEFDDKDAAAFALSRSGKDFEESTIDIYPVARCTLFVANFPPTADESVLRSLFERFGDIVDLRLPSLKGNTNRRFCYIQFKYSEQALGALEMNGYEAEPGFVMTVQISDPGNKHQRSDASDEERQLFVRNLSFKISEKALQSAFSEYGIIEKVKIPQNDKSQSKGFGFVTFVTAAAARAALAMDGKELKGRALGVTIAKKSVAHVAAARTTRSKSPIAAPNGNAASPSAMSVSSIGENQLSNRRDRTIALVNVPDTVNASRIKALAEKHGTIAKVVLKPDHQGAILEFTDPEAAGKAGLALEGHEIVPDRTLRVVTVEEMRMEKPEIKVDKILVGKKLLESKSKPEFVHSGVVKRPGQGAARRGGHLGQKKGLGYKSANLEQGEVVADDDGRNGQRGKTNDEFRAMLEKK